MLQGFQGLNENNNYYHDIILDFKLENNLKNLNEDFKDLTNKDYVKTFFDTIDNSIGLQLKKFFNDKYVYSLI